MKCGGSTEVLNNSRSEVGDVSTKLGEVGDTLAGAVTALADGDGDTNGAGDGSGGREEGESGDDEGSGEEHLG